MNSKMVMRTTRGPFLFLVFCVALFTTGIQAFACEIHLIGKAAMMLDEDSFKRLRAAATQETLKLSPALVARARAVEGVLISFFGDPVRASYGRAAFIASWLRGPLEAGTITPDDVQRQYGYAISTLIANTTLNGEEPADAALATMSAFERAKAQPLGTELLLAERIVRAEFAQAHDPEDLQILRDEQFLLGFILETHGGVIQTMMNRLTRALD